MSITPISRNFFIGLCIALAVFLPLELLAVPATPSAITGPSSDADGSFSLSWGNVPGATRYNLQRRGNGQVWATVQNSVATSFNQPTLPPAVYDYRVKACIDAACGNWTANKTVTVGSGEIGTPSPITGPTTDSDGSFSLSWGSVSGANRYNLQRKGNGAAWATVQNNSSTSYVESGLPAAVYDYRVKACINAACGAWTVLKTVTVGGDIEAPAGIVGPDEDSDGHFTLSWNGVSGATRYNLMRRQSGQLWTTVQNNLTTSFSENGLAAAVYDYRVKACGSNGCSAWTQVKSVVVDGALPTPSIFGPSYDADGDYLIFWTSVTGATRYVLQRRSNGGQWATIQNSSSSEFSEVGRSDGLYEYRVRGCDAASICSPWTGPLAVTVADDPDTNSTTDFGLQVPAYSDDGNYEITWIRNEGQGVQLQEKVNNGTYSALSLSTVDFANQSLQFRQRPVGTYTYRVLSTYCHYTCSTWYGLPRSVVVTNSTNDALSALESRVDEYFFEVLTAIRSDVAEIEDLATIFREQAESELLSAVYEPDSRSIREKTVIEKIRFLQNIGTGYAQNSVPTQLRTTSGYLFRLDGETDLGIMMVAGTIPNDLDVLLHSYFALQYTTVEN